MFQKHADTIAGAALHSLDGSANEAGFAPLLNLFAQARRSIEGISATSSRPAAK